MVFTAGITFFKVTVKDVGVSVFVSWNCLEYTYRRRFGLFIIQSEYLVKESWISVL